jgi:hypothetical protein
MPENCIPVIASVLAWWFSSLRGRPELMLTFDDARKAADYLRVRTEVERASLIGFVTLIPFTILSMAFPHEIGLRWFFSFFGGLVLIPLILRVLLPKGNRIVFFISLATYVLNGLLLAHLLYRELWKADPFELAEEFPQWLWLCPLITVLVPAVYYVLRFTTWKRRLLAWPEMRKILSDPPDPVHLGVVEGMVKKVTSLNMPKEAQWAEFRSVPATPKNWKLFMKLDVERHGVWRVAFEWDFALVAFRDGSQCEAVPMGGLKMAIEDPEPGARQTLCLVRWNQHLKEGRVQPDHYARIREWNAGRA